MILEILVSSIALFFFFYLLRSEIKERKRKKQITEIRCPNCGHWVAPSWMKVGVAEKNTIDGKLTHTGVGCVFCVEKEE